MKSENHPRPTFGGRFHDNAPYGREAEQRFAAVALNMGLGYVDTSLLDDPRAAPPRVIFPHSNLRMPDFVVVGDGRTVLAEVKRHEAPSLHRATGLHVTGTEVSAWADYLAMGHECGLPVILAFEHDVDPPGFVGGRVDELRACISHTAAGMIFWPVARLRALRTPKDMGFPAADTRQDEPPDDREPNEVPGEPPAPGDFDVGGWR